MEIALRVASGHPMAPVSPPTARIIRSEFSIYPHDFVLQIRTKMGPLMKWYVILLSFLSLFIAGNSSKMMILRRI